LSGVLRHGDFFHARIRPEPCAGHPEAYPADHDADARSAIDSAADTAASSVAVADDAHPMTIGS
jgi:hypothetical protein